MGVGGWDTDPTYSRSSLRIRRLLIRNNTSKKNEVKYLKGWSKINTYNYLYSETICQTLKRNKDFLEKQILREFITGGPAWQKNVNTFLREKKNDIDRNSDK